MTGPPGCTVPLSGATFNNQSGLNVNIPASGTTTVHGGSGRQLGSFTLTDPLDAALIDDTRVAHGVTPVTPLDQALPAFRDVLVVTFRRL